MASPPQDFGLALSRTVLQTTQVSSRTLLGNTIAGTLDYAAPEQLGKLEGVPVSPASDVYGFAKTCCHALFQTPEPTLRLRLRPAQLLRLRPSRLRVRKNPPEIDQIVAATRVGLAFWPTV